jgi:putative membrane protein
MNTIHKSGVAALALTLGLGLGAIGAGAQTSTGGTSATDSTTSGMSESNASGSGTSGATGAGSGAIMPVDKATFVTQATSSNMFEIESSKLAAKNAQSSDVKEFAEEMIADHTKAGNRMESTLQKEGLKATKALSSRHEAMLQELEAAEGADFDKAYVMAQTQAHMEAVTLFRSYASSPDDKNLGAFAKKTLPTLEKHLEHVQMLNSGQ